MEITNKGLQLTKKVTFDLGHEMNEIIWRPTYSNRICHTNIYTTYFAAECISPRIATTREIATKNHAGTSFQS